jgi:hypothetical protein
MDPHRLAELRSLAYHRAVLAKLDGDGGVLENARKSVQTMFTEGRSIHYAEAWRDLLNGSIARLREVLVADTEQARALRQATPFAGAIGARERWQIWKEVRERQVDA